MSVSFPSPTSIQSLPPWPSRGSTLPGWYRRIVTFTLLGCALVHVAQRRSEQGHDPGVQCSPELYFPMTDHLPGEGHSHRVHPGTVLHHPGAGLYGHGDRAGPPPVRVPMPGREQGPQRLRWQRFDGVRRLQVRPPPRPRSRRLEAGRAHEGSDSAFPQVRRRLHREELRVPDAGPEQPGAGGQLPQGQQLHHLLGAGGLHLRAVRVPHERRAQQEDLRPVLRV